MVTGWLELLAATFELTVLQSVKVLTYPLEGLVAALAVLVAGLERPFAALAGVLDGTASLLDVLASTVEIFNYAFMSLVVLVEYALSAENIVYNVGAVALGLALLRENSGVVDVLLALLSTDWAALTATLLDAMLGIPDLLAAVTGVTWLGEIPLLMYFIAGKWYYEEIAKRTPIQEYYYLPHSCNWNINSDTSVHYPEATNVEECQALCDSDKDCEGFEFPLGIGCMLESEITLDHIG